MSNSTDQVRIADLLRRTRRHMSRRRKGQSFLLFLLMVGSAFADVVSLGAVLPFIGVLTSPETVMEFAFVEGLADRLGITDPRDLLLPITIAFATAAMLSGAIRVLILWAHLRLSVAIDSDMSIECFRRTLHQPYSVHVSRNSSELISAILTKSGAIAGELVRPLLLFAGAVVVLVAVAATLVAIDAQVAISTAFVLGVSYGITAWLGRRRLERNSEILSREHPRSLKAVQEGLGGIRDILLDGTQDVYTRQFSHSYRAMRVCRASNSFINSSPRMVLEAIGIVALSGLTYGFSNRDGGIEDMLPVIAAVVFAAQRLIPSAHQAYHSWATLVGNRQNVADALDLLEQPMPPATDGVTGPEVAFRDCVRFEEVGFRYRPEAPDVLDGLEMEIPRGSQIGLVGATGSGKSTALDLLMGLLEPTNGRVSVDGETIGPANLRSWQARISHVPQFIFLADVSIAENIALGVPPDRIDWDRLDRAVERAQATEFVSDLPAGLRSMIGERGVRLSGGQRQRLGIARALYKASDLLVLDEATSALDNETERKVTRALAEDQGLTVVIVAHRLTTIRHCDRIFELADGKVVASGTYDDLVSSSPSFRRMAHSDQEAGDQEAGEEEGQE